MKLIVTYITYIIYASNSATLLLPQQVFLLRNVQHVLPPKDIGECRVSGTVSNSARQTIILEQMESTEAKSKIKVKK